MSTLISIIWFLVIFTVVVVSHEFGHYIIARANGIHVKEFYVGFGPSIIHWTKGGTKYSIKLLPLGGACVFDGMDAAFDDEKDAEEVTEGRSFADKARLPQNDEAGSETSVAESPVSESLAAENSESEITIESAENGIEEDESISSDSKEGSFLAANVWARFATILAGPAFNVLLGFIIAFIMVNMIAIRDPVATEVTEGGAAEAAGLEAGDRIVSLNGEKICLYEDIVLFNTLFDGGDILVVYERDGEQYQTVLTPEYSEEYGRYLLGISNATFIELKGLDAFKYAWYEVRYNLKMTYGSLGMLVRGKVKSTDVSGPVGIAVNVVGATYNETKQYGFTTVLVNMLNIALMLTINLGILNLLPIPALDGGRLLFIIIEILRGKPVPPKKEALVHFIGIVFFLILIVLVFFNDIKNIFM